ncbi:S8 family serine peptidase [Frankia sp. Cj3]|uniref:S8 family peptidase n=1 Tax=Frankia sp. Cj3 TaxID=2880976 RepID=UPI001EF46A2B|nr:S8 family serine peptidase [Frankia sp. Cj3]
MTGTSFGPQPRRPRAETTGSFLVLLDQEDQPAGVRALQQAMGVSIANAADLPEGATGPPSGTAGIQFPGLGVAVVDVPPDTHPRLQAIAEESRAVHAVEAERVVYAADALLTGEGSTYLDGYRDAVTTVIDNLRATSNGQTAQTTVRQTRIWDESQATWGLQATGVTDSPYSGRDVKVAVLDTGFDLAHPDFASRTIISQSFVPGQDVQDIAGHGTHCIGTACGPRQPATLPRYGIAYNAGIFAGKVLDNTGRGADRNILAGINWAVTNACKVVSMSLGAPTNIGQLYSTVFENVARRAMNADTLIVAAAGNDSRRHDGLIAPVEHPANCPSIIAVAAVDEDLDVADFSCGGINANGGEVNIAAPGVNVYSSWPLPTRYRRLSGTSMATPHVAGITALLAEAKPAAGPLDLADLLLANARTLSLPARDVGAGLVQAP